MSFVANWFFGAKQPSFAPQQTPRVEGLHRPLHVELVAHKDYPKIKKIARHWQFEARDKMTRTEGSEYSRLKDCANIADCMGDHCAKKWKTQKQLYACKDAAGRVHGLALVFNNFPQLNVDYLITDPKDMRCSVNVSEPGRVEGVGSAFCKFVEKEAPKHGITSIRLNAVDSAVPFYLKSGFTLKKGSDMVKPLPTTPKLSSKL